MNRSIQAELRELIAAEALSQSRRALRLKVGRNNIIGADLLLQRIDVQEALNDGIAARLTCLSVNANLPLKSFIGQSVEVQIVTDQGALRRICAIVTHAKAGQSDGSLTVYELEARDALSVLERRINSRIFRDKSDLDIVEVLLGEWRQRSSALAACFNHVTRVSRPEDYPPRAFVHQFNESDAAFLRRLLKRSGISWFFRAGADDGQIPQHEMVLFDHTSRLESYAGGPLRYHGDRATERRDAITRIVHEQTLVAGAVERLTRDYKAARIDLSSDRNGVDQGDEGAALAALLLDVQVDTPHAGDDWADMGRRTRRRMGHHEFEAQCLRGESGVRDLAVGECIQLIGHPRIDTLPDHEREFVVLEVTHRAENNLPKELDAQVHLLTGHGEHTLDDDKRYKNAFRLVRRDTPIAPKWNPALDLPRVHPLTAIVVGPEGEEVFTDELGRVKIQFQGYKPQDHEHAQGAGTNGNGSDSAWVRFVMALAGNRFGANFIPRIGMEAYIDFEGGDPDKPVVVGIVHNGRNMPAEWSNAGELPSNRYLSGIKTREIRGSGYNQLRYDDTPGQISIQWSSSYAATQLNGGWLTQPRSDGKGEPRGEGLEARSDAQVAVRGGKGVYVTAQPQSRAGGNMLERQALLGLAEHLQGIVKTLGELSSTHHADDTDTARIEKIVTQLKNWDGGSNVNEQGRGGGAPMVAIDAPAGIAVTSQDALLLGAQSHIDTVSAGNTQVSAGRKLLMRAADIFSAFAHKGMKLVTAEGDLQIEAHKDDVKVIAAKRIMLIAGEEFIVQSPRITHVAQGVQVDYASGRIVEQSQSLHHIMSPDFSIGGAGGGNPQRKVPTSKREFDQQVVMRWQGSNEPMKNQRYRITTEDGKVIEGLTDSHGRTERFDSNVAYGRYTIEPLND